MSLAAPTVTMLGYQMCPCGRPVLDEVAYKTGGLCGDCFRIRANDAIAAHMVVIAGREKLVLRPLATKRTPAELRQRKRAKKRNGKTAGEKRHQTKVNQAKAAATRRLRNLFPEMWEILLADERSKAGLDAFTIDRCLHGEPLSSSFKALGNYSHTEVPE